MKTIESLLEKATAKGSFHDLEKDEAKMLSYFSRFSENYEDNFLKLMPIKPKSLQQAIEFKMAELGINQAKLAEELENGAPKLS
jgi:HTH-type transcriptional regulator / antitoxin HigA